MTHSRASAAALMAVVLTIAWLTWSGKFEPLFFAFGAASVAVTMLLAARMDLFRHDEFALRLLPGLPRFWFWYAPEVAKSALHVARISLSRDLPIDPTVVQLEMKSPSPAGVATFGNCITFTPGTVTLDVRAGVLTVHCLTRAAADDLLGGVMRERVVRLES
jgi:multicomponent Na+:H+ antiporter subunit E